MAEDSAGNLVVELDLDVAAVAGAVVRSHLAGGEWWVGVVEGGEWWAVSGESLGRK